MYNEDGHRQTQIRVWSAAELFCRTLAIECLGIAVMSALKIPEVGKPEDERGEENIEKSKNSKKILTFGHPSIHQFFKSKQMFDYDEEMKALEKERRLSIQRMKQLEWRARRETMEMHRWVESVLVQDVVTPVVREGSIKVLEVAMILTEEIVGEAWIMLSMLRLEKDKQKQRRLNKAGQLQEEALKNRKKEQRLQRAKMLSLESRLGVMEVTPAAEMTGRKRKREWFHVEVEEKKVRREIHPCCTWERLGQWEEDTIKSSMSQAKPHTTLSTQEDGLAGQVVDDSQVLGTGRKKEKDIERIKLKPKSGVNRNAEKVKKWVKLPSGLFGWRTVWKSKIKCKDISEKAASSTSDSNVQNESEN